MNKQEAIFGAGCFWGVQYYFDQVPGVIKTEVGYSGGDKTDPSYEDVLSHSTGHVEVIKVDFDTDKVSYETLLKHFFRMHDPTQVNRQGPDVGENYRSVIFYVGQEQKSSSEKLIAALNKSGKYKKPIATTVEEFKKFWPAEDYHQKFSARTGRGVCHIDYAPV